MSRGVVLGVIVAEVLAARSPVDVKLSLFGSVLDPIESHVDGASLIQY